MYQKMIGKDFIFNNPESDLHGDRVRLIAESPEHRPVVWIYDDRYRHNRVFHTQWVYLKDIK